MKNNNVYVLIRRTPDTKDHMVEIMGIFSSEKAAHKHREVIYQDYEFETHVEKFHFLDLTKDDVDNDDFYTYKGKA